MPPKPAMMAVWLGKAKEGQSGTVIHSPAALSTQRNEAVGANTMLFFISCFQINLPNILVPNSCG